MPKSNRTGSWFVLIASLVATSGTLRAQSHSPSELAGRVEKILSKHCSTCHGNDAKTAKAGLRIMDIKDLIARNLIRPKSADDSELVNRIEDGSMPPLSQQALTKADRLAVREWVEAGAPAFPDHTIGHEYVLDQIRQDLQKIPSDERGFVRYFSLNHLRGERSAEELDGYRVALNAAVASLSRMPGNLVKPLSIDPSGSVFRIDLRHFGWHRKPHENGSLMLWDLVLLEYPYGFIDTARPGFQQMCESFLGIAEQIRPIPYIRGDWFVWLATIAAFTADFKQTPFAERVADPEIDPALIEIAQRFANGRVTLGTAVAELGSIRSEVEIASTLRTPVFSQSPMGSLSEAGGAVDRATWESEFPKVVRALQIGVPIEAIDATIWPIVATKSSTGIRLKTNHADNVFVGRETIDFLIDNRTEDSIYSELAVIGAGVSRLMKPTRIDRGTHNLTSVTPEDDEPAKESVILFCSMEPFPAYQLVGGGSKRFARDESRNITSRIVHPVYRLQASDAGWELKDSLQGMHRDRIIVETRRP